MPNPDAIIPLERCCTKCLKLGLRVPARFDLRVAYTTQIKRQANMFAKTGTVNPLRWCVAHWKERYRKVRAQCSKSRSIDPTRCSGMSPQAYAAFRAKFLPNVDYNTRKDVIARRLRSKAWTERALMSKEQRRQTPLPPELSPRMKNGKWRPPHIYRAIYNRARSQALKPLYDPTPDLVRARPPASKRHRELPL